MPTITTFGAAAARGFGLTTAGRLVVDIVISSNTANYVLGTSKVTGYRAGKADVTLTIDSGVTVYSASTGSYAFTVDNSWSGEDTITIVNNGTILGKGGAGGDNRGNVPYCDGAPQNGNSAGPALYVQYATSFDNVGRISGGGGGGGAGASGLWNGFGWTAGAGGGGIGNGAAGYSCDGAPAASAGTLVAAGAGGVGQGGDVPPPNGNYLPHGGTGGTGGSYAASGSTGGNAANGATNLQSPGTGGSGGAAVVGNSNITWVATGTRNGNIS